MRLSTKLSLISDADIEQLMHVARAEPQINKLARAVEREASRRERMHVLW